MSLFDEALEKFVFLEESSTPDSYGSQDKKWTEGREFDAALCFDNSIQAKIAQKQGITALYTLVHRKGLSFRFHDVIKRVSDGKIFRITSDGGNCETPKSATLNMAQTTAEEWSLPNG